MIGYAKLKIRSALWWLVLSLTCCLLLSPTVYADEAVNSVVDEYYQSLNDVPPEGFREALSGLISKHTYISNKNIWRYLEASHESASESESVVLFYTRRVTPKSNKASGSNQANNDYWNREHVWPQSYGLKRTKAKRDIHNIVPADRSVNTSRSNKYFDIGGAKHDECDACFTDHDSWEPPHEVKGDVARILFYMDVRYEGLDASGADDLQLGWTNSDILFEWHCADPVSPEEKRKNNGSYKFQGNRNPFVDRPEWVQAVYNAKC